MEKYLKRQSPPQVQLETKKEFIFIRKDRKQVKLHFDTVLYIESLKDYIRIHSPSTTHVIKHSLNGFEALLDKRYLRIHRSYIINKDKITAYTKNDVEIGAYEIPIGSHYRQVVEAALGGYWSLIKLNLISPSLDRTDLRNGIYDCGSRCISQCGFGIDFSPSRDNYRSFQVVPAGLEMKWLINW